MVSEKNNYNYYRVSVNKSSLINLFLSLSFTKACLKYNLLPALWPWTVDLCGNAKHMHVNYWDVHRCCHFCTVYSLDAVWLKNSRWCGFCWTWRANCLLVCSGLHRCWRLSVRGNLLFSRIQWVFFCLFFKCHLLTSYTWQPCFLASFSLHIYHIYQTVRQTLSNQLTVSPSIWPYMRRRADAVKLSKAEQSSAGPENNSLSECLWC